MTAIKPILQFLQKLGATPIRYSAERMGWGGMPHEGTLSFSREGDTISLRSVDNDPSILGRARKYLELNLTPGLPIR